MSHTLTFFLCALLAVTIQSQWTWDVRYAQIFLFLSLADIITVRAGITFPAAFFGLTIWLKEDMNAWNGRALSWLKRFSTLEIAVTVWMVAAQIFSLVQHRLHGLTASMRMTVGAMSAATLFCGGMSLGLLQDRAARWPEPGGNIMQFQNQSQS